MSSVFIDIPARHQSIAVLLQVSSINNIRSVPIGVGMLIRAATNTVNAMVPQSTKVWGVGLALVTLGVHREVLSPVEPKKRATSMFLVSLERLDLLLGAAFI